MAGARMRPRWRTRDLLMSAVLCFVAPASADGLGFKGLELGSPLARIAGDTRFDCRPLRTPIADRVCSLRHGESETIAGAPLESMFLFYDRQRLTGITLSLPEKHFQNVVEALRGKYGDATPKTEAVRNFKGAAFENRLYHWHQGDFSLRAERYAGRLDRSSIRYTDDAAEARLREHRARAARDPRLDL